MITENFTASQSWLSLSPWRSAFLKCHLINKEVMDCCHSWSTATGLGKEKGQRITDSGRSAGVRPAWMEARALQTFQNSSCVRSCHHVPGVSRSWKDAPVNSLIWKIHSVTLKWKERQCGVMENLPDWKLRVKILLWACGTVLGGWLPFLA